MRVAPAPHNLRGAMDYCDQCRRHLNGALACAGCGTPAEVLGHQAPPPPGPHHSRLPGQGAGGEEDHGEYGDAPEGELVLTGRHPEPPEPVRRRKSSRRRKPAPRPRTKPRRARSRRGRRVLIATLGVVLALATLSLAELAMESSDPDGRATAVKEEKPVDFDGGPDDTERPAAPSDPGPAPSEESGTGGTDGSASPGASGAAGTGASGEASTSSSASPGEPGEIGPGPSASGSPGPSDSAPGSPGPSRPTGSPTSGGPTTTESAPPPPPEPDPEPTDSCWFFICL